MMERGGPIVLFSSFFSFCCCFSPKVCVIRVSFQFMLSLLHFTRKKKDAPPPSPSLSLPLPLRARSLEGDLLPHVPPRPLAEPVRARVGLDGGPVLVGHDAPAQAAVALDPALRLFLFVCFFLLIPLSCC